MRCFRSSTASCGAWLAASSDRTPARRRSGATALVHEAYLKLVDHTQANVQDRHHFFAVAARAMRQILVDYVRRRRARKRGGGQVGPLETDSVPVDAHVFELLAIDRALTRLEALDRTSRDGSWSFASSPG